MVAILCGHDWRIESMSIDGDKAIITFKCRLCGMEHQAKDKITNVIIGGPEYRVDKPEGKIDHVR